MKINPQIKSALESVAFGIEVALREDSKTDVTKFDIEDSERNLDRTVYFEFPDGSRFFVSVMERKKNGVRLEAV